MKQKLLFLLVWLWASTGLLQAQDRNFTGVVKDANATGIPGVSVVIKNTTRGTNTDSEGKFKIDAPAGSTFVFSAIGFTKQELKPTGSTISITLEPDVSSLNEVVVVGYGTQKKATITGAVTALQGEKLIQSPAVDLSNSLAGRLPGLVVIQQSGEPGNDGALIRIRGANTLGNSSPLIVIDGIPDRDGGLGRLSPRDVESISVLKDASAAAIGGRPPPAADRAPCR